MSMVHLNMIIIAKTFMLLFARTLRGKTNAHTCVRARYRTRESKVLDAMKMKRQKYVRMYVWDI